MLLMKTSIKDRVFWKFQSAWRYARTHPEFVVILSFLVYFAFYFGTALVLVFSFAGRHDEGDEGLSSLSQNGSAAVQDAGLFATRMTTDYILLDSWEDWSKWLLKSGEQPRRSETDVLAALPDNALEKVVLQYSDVGDKKSLRLTCRYIRNIVDTNMTTAGLSNKQVSLQDAACWLWRIGRCSKMYSLVLKQDFPHQTLNKCMPQKLTSLYMHQNISLSILQQLPNLTCLRIASSHEAGLEQLSNCSHLTRLEAPRLMLTSWMIEQQNKVNASNDEAVQKQERVVANKLPPSLQYLQLREPPLVEYIAHLTNLKVLVITSRFFSYDTLDGYKSVFNQLPLEHLTWPAECSGVHLEVPDVLKHLPGSLISVAFSGIALDWVLEPVSMPTRVTRLQLLDLCSQTAIQTFAAAAPGIIKLDVSILYRPTWPSSETSAAIASIKHVCQFEKLRFLGLYAATTNSQQEVQSVMGLHQLSRAVPDITKLITLGLSVQVCNVPSALDPYYAWPDGPGWAMTCV